MSSLLLFFILLYLLFSMVSISLIQISLSLAFFCWLFLNIKQKSWPRFPSFFWPLLVYCMFSLLSSFKSVNPKISMVDSRELLLFLIVPITFTAISSEKSLKKVNYAFLISACASASYSLFTFLFLAEPGERILGFMGHWMTQAGLLLLFCSFALSQKRPPPQQHHPDRGRKRNSCVIGLVDVYRMGRPISAQTYA